MKVNRVEGPYKADRSKTVMISYSRDSSFEGAVVNSLGSQGLDSCNIRVQVDVRYVFQL